MYRDDNAVSFIVGTCLFFNGALCSQWLTTLSVPCSGKGLHAEDGVSKLRPALEELFDEYVGEFYLALFWSTHAWRLSDAA